jgi:Putative viral replication protein.
MAKEYLGLWHAKGAARYVNGQVEKGKEGTIHIQYYLNFENSVRLSQLKKHCPKSHFEPVGKDNGASAYAMKEDTRVEGPWEFGLKPAKRNVKGDVAEQNKKILEIGVEKCIQEGLIHLKDYLKLKQCVNAYKLNTAPPMDHTNTKGRWIYGEPGVGKSRLARELYPGAYIKNQNKWWDGYEG